MTAHDIVARLREHATELRKLGVLNAGVFGSAARGEAGPDSDIDIGLRLDPEARLGVYEYVGVLHFLQDIFPGRVDVANLAGLPPGVRESVERDFIRAF